MKQNTNAAREEGQAVAEYAAMLGLLLLLFFIVSAIGLNSNYIFNFVASTLN